MAHGPTPCPWQEEFSRCVALGFQASATLQQGSIVAQEEGAAGGSRAPRGGGELRGFGI